MDFLAIRVYQYLLYVKLGNIHLVFFMHIFGSGLGINSEKMDSINIFLMQISLYFIRIVVVLVTHYIYA